ncbi:MAG: SAM-dependent methyltransferase, partial [Rhodanobacter sp.]
GAPAMAFAGMFPAMRIDAVTISPAQAFIAHGYMASAGLSSRVTVRVSDFHENQGIGCFDRVLFLESAGYSDNRARLWESVYSALKPGGMVYMKEPMVVHGEALNPVEERALAECYEKYRYIPMRATALAGELKKAGFSNVEVKPLFPEVSADAFRSAMFNERGELTAFGKAHWSPTQDAPATYFSAKAMRPING